MRVLSRSKKRTKTRLKLLLAGVAAPVLLCLLAPTLLKVEIAPSRASTLIVLGGAPRSRAATAAEVFKTFEINRIIISGTGDCEKTRGFLLTNGVPEELIVLECTSSSTYENAMYARPLLLTNCLTYATIVTHWYHSRRALATFRSVIPEVNFAVQSTSQHLNGSGLPTTKGIKASLIEYIKIAYYLVRYGVNPFTQGGNTALSESGSTPDRSE